MSSYTPHLHSYTRACLDSNRQPQSLNPPFQKTPKTVKTVTLCPQQHKVADLDWQELSLITATQHVRHRSDKEHIETLPGRTKSLSPCRRRPFMIPYLPQHKGPCSRPLWNAWGSISSLTGCIYLRICESKGNPSLADHRAAVEP